MSISLRSVCYAAGITVLSRADGKQKLGGIIPFRKQRRSYVLLQERLLERSYIAANLAARALKTAVNVEIQIVRQKIRHICQHSPRRWVVESSAGIEIDNDRTVARRSSGTRRV